MTGMGSCKSSVLDEVHDIVCESASPESRIAAPQHGKVACEAGFFQFQDARLKFICS
jgi:hypothetical protein